MSSTREEKITSASELPEDVLMHTLDMFSVGGLSACARVNQTFFKLSNELKQKKFPLLHDEIRKELDSLPSEILCQRGEKNVALALYILESGLYIKFGAHMPDMARYFQGLVDKGQGLPDKVTQWKGEWLFRLGNAHAATARFILEGRNLRVKLSNDQIQLLAEKLDIDELREAERNFRRALGGQYRHHYHIARLESYSEAKKIL